MDRSFFAWLGVALLSVMLTVPSLRAQDDQSEGGGAPPQGDNGPDNGGDQGAPPDGNRNPGGDQMSEKIKERLGLSDEQFSKLKDARKAHEDVNKPLRHKAMEEMKKLGSELKAKADEKAVQATLDEIETTHQAIEDENRKFMSVTKTFLTPTQRAKLIIGVIMNQRRGRPQRGGMNGPRRGGEGGEGGGPGDGGGNGGGPGGGDGGSGNPQ
jgi:Spy/CpxP family protein refolding chaperone